MLAYFNVIDDRDAQCFEIDASILGGAYILGAGAVCLSLLNSFVGNAVVQYFRDRDENNERSFGWKQESIVRCMSQTIAESPSTVRSAEVEEGAAEICAASSADSNDEIFGDRVDDLAFEERKEALKYIKPAPVLFTDKYRWFLCRGEYKEDTGEFTAAVTDSSPHHELGEVTEQRVISESSDEEQPSTPTMIQEQPLSSPPDGKQKNESLNLQEI